MASSPDGQSWQDEIPELLPMALRLAIRLCGDPNTAEDAVQNAMLKLIRSIDRFEGRSKLSTYFSRIVIHECRNLIDRAQRSGPTTALDELNAFSEGPVDHRQPRPDERLQQAELNAQVRLAVEDLPSRQREVFVLSVWEQLPNHEIAELLDITLANTHATLSLARKFLKQRLQTTAKQERPN